VSEEKGATRYDLEGGTVMGSKGRKNVKKPKQKKAKKEEKKK